MVGPAWVSSTNPRCAPKMASFWKDMTWPWSSVAKYVTTPPPPIAYRPGGGRPDARKDFNPQLREFAGFPLRLSTEQEERWGP
jgi:hypothetical protein